MIKYGVIGSGWIAEEFVRGAQTVDGMCFAAMYSRTYEKGKEFAEKFELSSSFVDYDKFLKGCYYKGDYI